MKLISYKIVVSEPEAEEIVLQPMRRRCPDGADAARTDGLFEDKSLLKTISGRRLDGSSARGMRIKHADPVPCRAGINFGISLIPLLIVYTLL